MTVTEVAPITGAALAGEVLAAVKARPELFDMYAWAEPTECGTAMCVAGWAVALNGGKFVTYPPSERDGYESPVEDVDMPDGRRILIPTEAARLFGIGADYADCVFNEDEDEAIKWLEAFAATGAPPDLTELWDDGCTYPAPV